MAMSNGWWTCRFCENVTNQAFHSHYAQIMVDTAPDSVVPFFCDVVCMCRWVGVKLDKPFTEIKKDFGNYCKK